MSTAKRSIPALLKRSDQALNARITPQSRRDQCSQHKHQVERIQMPLLHIAPNPPLRPTIKPRRLSSHRIKPFTFLHRVLLDVEAEHEHWREGVRELQDAERGDKAGEGAEIGDRGSNDEGDAPVDGNHADPDEFSGFGGEAWEAEELLKDILIYDLGNVSLPFRRRRVTSWLTLIPIFPYRAPAINEVIKYKMLPAV